MGAYDQGKRKIFWDLNDDFELPCYWIIDEKIDEIKEAIELDERDDKVEQ